MSRSARSSTSPPGRPRRRWRPIRWILLFGLALVFLGGLASRARLEEWAWSAVERALAREGLEAHVGRLRIDLLRLSVQASDVTIRPSASPRGRLEVDVPFVRLDLAWRTLLGPRRGRVHLRRLLLERPRVATDDAFLHRPPRPGAQPLALDLRIDGLRIRGGEWRHEDRSTPLELEVAGLDLRGTWSADRRAMLGDARFGFGVRQDPLARPLRLDVRGRFRWRGRRVDVFELQAAGEELGVEGEGSVDLARVPRVQATGQLRVDLDRLQVLLRPDATRLGGRARGTLVVEAGGSPLRVHGPVHGEALRVGGIAATELDARLTYTPGRIQLEQLAGSAHGGRVAGSVTVGLHRPTRVELDLTGEGLDGSSVLEWLQLPLPLSARLDTHLRFAGEVEARRSWNGTGDFVLLGVEGSPERLATSGEGRFELQEGRLELRAHDVRSAEARFAVQTSAELAASPLSGTVSIGGTTADARATQRAVLRIFEHAGLAAPELLRRELAGTGSFEARFALGGARAVELRLDLIAGAWGREAFEHAALELTLAGTELELRRVELERAAARLRGAVRLQLEPWSIEAVDVSAADVPISDLLALLGKQADLEGLLTAELRTSRGTSGLAGSGTLRIVDGRWFGEDVAEAVAQLDVSGDRLTAREARVRGPWGEARGEVELDVHSGATETRLSSATITLEGLEHMRDVPLRGQLGLSGTLWADTAGVVSGKLDATLGSFQVWSVPLGDFAGPVDLAPEGLRAGLASADAAWQVEGTVAWDPELTCRATLRLADAEIDLTSQGPLPTWLRLTGEWSVVGPLRTPAQAQVEGTFTAAALDLGSRVLRLSAPAELRLAEQRLEIAPLRIEDEAGHVEGALRYDLGTDRLEASATGTAQLGLLSLWLPQLRAQGDAALDLELGGTLEAPELSGTLRVTNGRLRHLDLPIRLEDLMVDVRFRGRSIEIVEYAGLIGGGEIRGRGTVDLQDPRRYRVQLGAEASGVRIHLPAGFSGLYDASLTLSGDPEQLLLAGEVKLLRGLWSQDFELLSVLGTSAREYSPLESREFASRVALDVAMSTEDNLWLRNDLAEIEAGLDLHWRGTLERPELTGRIWALEGGRLRYRDVQYEVRSGGLEFSDPERIDPYVTLEAETTVGSYDVVLRVAGTMEHLEYELSSRPALSTQDIIALLTTGKTLQDLESEGRSSAAFTGDLAANYFAGALTGRFEEQIEHVLGLDRVRVDPLIVDTSDPTARLTVGKEIRDDVSVIVSTRADRAEEDLYQVEWRPSRRSLITAQRDTNGGVGADVYYTRRYWWKKPPPETLRAGTAPEADAGKARVSEVTIVGLDTETARQLAERVPLRPGEVFRRSLAFDGLLTIRRALVRQGHIEAHVEFEPQPEPGDRVRLLYRVTPGRTFAIEFVGVSSKERRALLRELQELWTESLFREDLYVDSVARIRAWFETRGFYAVDVYHEEREGTPRVLRFVVDRGEEVHVASVRIEGAVAVPEERIRRQMLTRPQGLLGGRSFQPRVLAEDTAAIRNLYRDRGYLAVVIAPPQVRLSAAGDAVDVTLTITEGPRFVLRTIEFRGADDLPPAQLEAWSGLHPGDVFSRAKLLEAESALRREIDERGHPAARVRGLPQIDAGGAVDLRFVIETGPQMEVAEIRIQGNTLTREGPIRRTLGLGVGETLSREKILRGQHALNRLGAFQSVRIEHRAVDETDPTRRIVEVQVTESQPLRVAVGLGYNTESALNVRLATSQDNLGGALRSIGVQGVVNADLRRVQALGKTPSVLGSAVPMLGSVLWERDSQTEGFTVERWATSVRVDRELSKRWRGFARYAYELVDVFNIEDPVAVQQEKLEDARLGSVEASVLFDSRDDAIAPKRGWMFLLSGRLFAEGLLSEFDFVKATATTSRTWSWPNELNFSTGARLGIAAPYDVTEEVPIQERFFAGGSATVRGFETDHLGPVVDGQPTGGEGLLVLNEEMRFPIVRQLRGVVFYDLGNVYRRTSDFDLSDVRHVMGIGVRLETPIGPLRAEYGWKLDREPEESRGQFFFSIGNAF